MSRVAEEREARQAHDRLADAIGSGRWVDASDALQRLIAFRPSQPSLHYTLGSVLRNVHTTAGVESHTHILTQARDAYAAAITLQPAYAEASIELASLTDELQHRDGEHATTSRAHVQALWSSALELQPSSTAAWQRWGDALVREDRSSHLRLSEAALRYGAALRLSPNDVEVAVALGLQQHKRGRWKAASQAYRTALQASPRHVQAIRLLGSLQARREPSLRAAEETLRLAWPAQTGESKAELGHVLQLQGRLDEAAALSADGIGDDVWNLQNELTLPMYVWAHRAKLDATPADELLRSCRPDGTTLATLLNAGTDIDGADGAPDGAASGAASGAPRVRLAPLLLGCSGDCVLRQTVVKLWASCRRSILDRRLHRGNFGSGSGSGGGGGGGADGGEHPARLAVRWGDADEVRLVLGHALAASSAAASAAASWRVLTSAAGELRLEALHEAAVRADCAVLGEVITQLEAHAPSQAELARALRRTDPFERTPLQLAEGSGCEGALRDALRATEGAVPAATARVGVAADEPPPPLSAELLTRAMEATASADAAAVRASATGGADGTAVQAAAAQAAAAQATAAQAADEWRVDPPQAARAAQARCDVATWEVGGATVPPEYALAAGATAAESASAAARAAVRLAARFTRDHVSLDRPLLMRGLLGETSRRAWQRGALRNASGRVAFQVMQYGSRASLADSHTWRRVSLTEWTDAMRASPLVTSAAATAVPPSSPSPPPPLPEYIFDQSTDMGDAAAGLRRQMHGVFPWRAMFAPSAPALYVGADGSGNPFHYHQQTWNALLAGRKRWLLYPPSQAFYTELHPLEWQRRAANRSMAAPLECEQRAGDVLFVPRLWAHATINVGEVVGVATPFALRSGVDYVAALRG